MLHNCKTCIKIFPQVMHFWKVKMKSHVIPQVNFFRIHAVNEMRIHIWNHAKNICTIPQKPPNHENEMMYCDTNSEERYNSQVQHCLAGRDDCSIEDKGLFEDMRFHMKSSTIWSRSSGLQSFSAFSSSHFHLFMSPSILPLQRSKNYVTCRAEK